MPSSFNKRNYLKKQIIKKTLYIIISFLVVAAMFFSPFINKTKEEGIRWLITPEILQWVIIIFVLTSFPSGFRAFMKIKNNISNNNGSKIIIFGNIDGISVLVGSIFMISGALSISMFIGPFALIYEVYDIKRKIKEYKKTKSKRMD